MRSLACDDGGRADRACKDGDFTIAAGIIRRMERGSEEPMTVIACENMEFGSSKLFESVKEHPQRGAARTTASGISVFRTRRCPAWLCPLRTRTLLTVKVEQYKEWVVDSAKVRGRPVGNTGH